MANKVGCFRQWYKVVAAVRTSGDVEIVARDFAGSEPKAKDLLEEYAREFPPSKGFITAVTPLKSKPENLIRVTVKIDGRVVNFYKVAC